MKKNKVLHFHIFALSIWDKGYSGGDRIFVELARRYVKKGHKVTIYTWERGREIIERERLSGAELKVYPLKKWLVIGFAFQYAIRIFQGIVLGSTLSQKHILNEKNTIVYCSSDFWMDSIPCFLLKLRFRKIQWIGTFYLTAPNPFVGFRERGKLQFPSINGLLYWLQQKPMYYVMRSFADMIFVTSEPDANKFPRLKAKGNYVVVYGGVDLDLVHEHRKEFTHIKKKYECIFMGRFHPQKGVLDLIDIWYLVVKEKPHAKLVMIGDGPLMDEVKKKIDEYDLEENILLMGYVLDGRKKYTLFSQSKIFIHPVIYDSGGMSAAEGMAWGLPAISFDLEALKTYYPKGMVKIPIGNNQKFSEAIIKLLDDTAYYSKVRGDAISLVEEEWDWNNRANFILKKIDELVLQ